MKCKDCPEFTFSLRRGAIASYGYEPDGYEPDGYMNQNKGYCLLKEEHVHGKRLTSCKHHPEADSLTDEQYKQLRHAERQTEYKRAKVKPHGLTTQDLRYRQTRARSGKGGYSQLQNEKLKNSLLTAEDK